MKLYSAYQLEVRQLTYARSEQQLFYNLNLTVSTGELLQIVGPNGAGKTTLLRIIAGLIQIDRGNIIWRGRDICQCAAVYRSQLAYLGHQLGVSLSLTPLENLKMTAAFHAVNKTQSFHQLLDQLNLLDYANHITGQLSAGQQRRTAFACLLIRHAPLWILDEPLAALDQAGATLVEQFLLNHIEQGGLAIITTHQSLSLPQIPVHLLDLSGDQKKIYPHTDLFQGVKQSDSVWS